MCTVFEEKNFSIKNQKNMFIKRFIENEYGLGNKTT